MNKLDTLIFRYPDYEISISLYGDQEYPGNYHRLKFLLYYITGVLRKDFGLSGGNVYD
jgi:hypothetical protein